MNLDNIIKNIIDISMAAGHKIMPYYQSGDIHVERKADDSPLTHADIASHQVIDTYLTTMFKDIPVISEEHQTTLPITENCPRFWLVDPLDGTKEFIKKSNEFTVNIALIEHTVPILGVVYAPALETLYYATKDSGSVKVDKNGKKTRLFQEKKTSNLMTIVGSKSHKTPEFDNYMSSLKSHGHHIHHVSIGSSLKFCLVAEGNADQYPRFGPTMAWDTAAGHAIVKYSGKNVLSLDTKKDLTYTPRNLKNGAFIAM